ncbi:MAG: DUF4160 domain-containing protein [Gammaproteobacteria bacterium]|nr:DUF4160 domain-containing protein [Gammaproteobacteria bacterium]MBT4606624.1 DUF4160 domain-containing protein [Thiotrichales bacterium]MBT5466653.1 DUF4160 domain-containing protein [Candidatus Neomarinimicrobiota bacterium]MBT5688630.1 DUF4160 domain-containing protein [Gammaproteobacteria bacterium]MBT7023431.1 DUF4160 domain-containing protein [Gammaproteobacteria bacterium]
MDGWLHWNRRSPSCCEDFSSIDHPPPHFHVYYAEYRATVDIRTCEILQGNLPNKRFLGSL